MNPTEAGTDRYSPVRTSAKTPPMRAKGMLTRTISAWRIEPNVVKSRTKMSPIATGTTTDRRAAARCWFSNWPPQVEPIALRQRQFRRHLLLRRLDEAHHVAAANIGPNDAHPGAVLAVYLDGTVDPMNARNLRERHVLPRRKRQRQVGQ